MSSDRLFASPAAVHADERTPYRAVSPWTVASLLLGLISILCFAHWIFGVVALAAVLTGVQGLRQVHAAPEEWVGRRLAQMGMAIALLSAVGAAAYGGSMLLRIRHQGRAVADRFVEKLRTGDIESAFWLTMPRQMRRRVTETDRQDLPKELTERYQGFYIELHEIVQELTSGAATIEFEEIEDAGNVHGDDAALVVYKVHSDHGDSHFLASVMSAQSTDTGEISWFVREYRAGYTPRSVSVHQRNDEHGHPH